jgi:protocatechuate 3,4-dioxygenase beta subunit
MSNDNDNEHDLGLRHDVPRLIQSPTSRRRVLAWLAAGGAGVAAGTFLPRDAAAAANQCAVPATETAGPFPAHGAHRHSRVANVLEQSGVVRRDLRSSFGAATGVAAGLPLDLTIRLLDANNACAPLAGWVVYLWHCTADGRYSLYEPGVTDENFLRGVQATDANGELQFTTIFPGSYGRRYPHFHFEVFPSLDVATVYTNRVLTSQIALPAEACHEVYKDSAYGNSAERFAPLSIERDGVFRDNSAEEMEAMTLRISGDVESGLEGKLSIGIA